MDEALERKLMEKYPFTRPKQDPQDLENDMEIMAKQITKDQLQNLESLEEETGKKGLISDKIKEYANKHNPDIYEKSIKPIWDLMVFGFECDNGWYDLLDKTFGAIQKHLNRHPNIKFELEQVKEKYGTLRIYYYGGDDYIEKIVSQAEKESAHICEVCGAKGKLCSNGIDIVHKKDGFYIVSNGGWYKTLCEKDAEKLGYIYNPKKITDNEAYKYLKEMKVKYEEYLSDSEGFGPDFIKDIKSKLEKVNKLLELLK